ncbi:MAG: hypothetical protein J6O04_05305, partial [Selenomonadaceae bacterium]|nr:hypothetical protein [Selenomonadaceae bacterium]
KISLSEKTPPPFGHLPFQGRLSDFHFCGCEVEISRSSASPERGGGPRSGGGVDREKLYLNLLYSIINFYETAVFLRQPLKTVLFFLFLERKRKKRTKRKKKNFNIKI